MSHLPGTAWVVEDDGTTSPVLKVVPDTPSGGTPGGSDTQVQFNNAGAFGGSVNFTWDDSLGVLLLAGQATLKLDVLTALSAANDGDIQIGDPNHTFIRFHTTTDIDINQPNVGGQVAISLNGGQLVVGGGETWLGAAKLSDVLTLTPIATPGSPDEGMIYAGLDHHLHYYNGTAWKQLDN